jgi:hypothetical protein
MRDKYSSYQEFQLITEAFRRFSEAAPAQEKKDSLKGFGSQTATQSDQAKASRDRAKDIQSGDKLGDVDNKERAMLLQIQNILTKVAEEEDLLKYRSALEGVLKRLLKTTGVDAKE